MAEPRTDQDDFVEVRCLWQRTDYGYITLKAAARGYGGRELGSYQDGITDERFAHVRAAEAEANPGWPLVESVIKVPAAAVVALFTDGTELSPALDDEEPVIERWDGGALCPTCGVEVRRHPYSTKVLDYQRQPFVHLLCDGTLAKT